LAAENLNVGLFFLIISISRCTLQGWIATKMAGDRPRQAANRNC